MFEESLNSIFHINQCDNQLHNKVISVSVMSISHCYQSKMCKLIPQGTQGVNPLNLHDIYIYFT